MSLTSTLIFFSNNKVKYLSKDFRKSVERKFEESFAKFKQKFELDEGRSPFFAYG